MAQLSFVLLSEDAEFSAATCKQLEATGQAQVSSVISEPDLLEQGLRTKHPDALLVDLGVDPEYVLERVAALPAPRPLMLMVGRTDQSQVILRAMRLGAKEFFPQAPTEQELRSAVERLALELPVVPAEVQKRAPVLAVMGAKGGVGATTVACQLAACLQAMGGQTAVVDLNLPIGDVALHFDVQPDYTLANVSGDAERLDATSLRTILQSHGSGVEILAAPKRVEEAELIRGPHVERVLALLRAEFDWVIVDVARSWSEASVRALDLADQILMVTLLDVPTLNHARAHLEILRRLGHMDSKIRIVANRHSRSDTVSSRDFVQFLGRAPDVLLPNEYWTTVDCLNQGRAIGEVAPRSKLHGALRRLAERAHGWCDVERPESEEVRGGFLSRLLGRAQHGTD